MAIREALTHAGMGDYVTAQAVNDSVWLKDTRRPTHGARWCYIEIDGPVLTIKNGRLSSSQISLADPGSIEALGEIISDSFVVTTLFTSDDA